MSIEVHVHAQDIEVEYIDFDEPTFTTCTITASDGSVVKFFLPYKERPIAPVKHNE